MQGFDKKKINFIIILIFGYFSISNLSKFNNYDVLKSLNDQDFIELSSELEGYDDLDAENDQKLKLTRKKNPTQPTEILMMWKLQNIQIKILQVII